LEAGFFRYLTKPIKVTEFLGTLDIAFESRGSPAASQPANLEAVL
jgi:hypothetical protein